MSAGKYVIRFVPKRAILFSLPPPPRCKSVKASSFLPTFLDGASPLFSLTRRRRPPATLKFKADRPRINSECDFYTPDFLSTFSTASLIFACYLEETLLSDGLFQQPTPKGRGFTHTEDLLGIQISWEWVTCVVQYQYKYWVQCNDWRWLSMTASCRHHVSVDPRVNQNRLLLARSSPCGRSLVSLMRQYLTAISLSSERVSPFSAA